MESTGAFEKRWQRRGLEYVVGITSATGQASTIVRPWATERQEPAVSLPARSWRSITWREGSNAALCSRFAAVRVRCASGNTGHYRLQPEQWLLTQWPEAQAEPENITSQTCPKAPRRRSTGALLPMGSWWHGV